MICFESAKPVPFGDVRHTKSEGPLLAGYSAELKLLDYDRTKFKSEEEAEAFLRENAPKTTELFLEICHTTAPVYEDKGAEDLMHSIERDIDSMGLKIKFEALSVTPTDEALAAIREDVEASKPLSVDYVPEKLFESARLLKISRIRSSCIYTGSVVRNITTVRYDEDGNTFWIVDNENPPSRYAARVDGTELSEYIAAHHVAELGSMPPRAINGGMIPMGGDSNLVAVFEITDKGEKSEHVVNINCMIPYYSNFAADINALMNKAGQSGEKVDLEVVGLTPVTSNMPGSGGSMADALKKYSMQGNMAYLAGQFSQGCRPEAALKQYPSAPTIGEMPEAAHGTWNCGVCGKKGNTGNFCPECGSKKQ